MSFLWISSVSSTVMLNCLKNMWVNICWAEAPNFTKHLSTEEIAGSLKNSFVQRVDKLHEAADIKRMTDGFPVLDQSGVPSGKSTERAGGAQRNTATHHHSCKITHWNKNTASFMRITALSTTQAGAQGFTIHNGFLSPTVHAWKVIWRCRWALSWRD